MTPEIIEAIVTLRASVGLFGEQGPAKRWPCAFFAPATRAFLSPLFPRTLILSQLQGVTAAAARAHDERIGVGEVFHLFRLPEELEQATHRLLTGPTASALVASVSAGAASASETLREFAVGQSLSAVGPVRVGSPTEMDDIGTWRKIASAYVSGFREGAEVYPFFSAK